MVYHNSWIYTIQKKSRMVFYPLNPHDISTPIYYKWESGFDYILSTPCLSWEATTVCLDEAEKTQAPR